MARSRNHGYSGKAISLTYSQCVCSRKYPGRNAHARYYIVTCGLPDSTFSQMILQTA